MTSDDLPDFDDPDEVEEQKKQNDEVQRLREKARELREQVQQMEEKLASERPARIESSNADDTAATPAEEPLVGRSLKDKRVLVIGANGQLGSMVCRHLLRNHPEVREVTAACHYIGEATTRGYGRLSYEVGAEDGVGTIGAAWSEDRNASFQYSDEMKDYNLNKLRVVELELLDPVQVRTITEDVDCVIYCATDFKGNRPRAIASLNAAFLFRAVASPDKGRVEIEGLRNVVEGLVAGKQERRWKSRRGDIMATPPAGGSDVASESPELDGPHDPIAFVLVSTSPDAFGEFETPYGEFNGLKRQGEEMLQKEFPSLTHSILQMGRYDERMGEGLDINYGSVDSEDVRQIQINRRDAARAAVDAFVDDDLIRKKVQVWTATR